MTLVVIGPVTQDLIVIGDESSRKIGGAHIFRVLSLKSFTLIIWRL